MTVSYFPRGEDEPAPEPPRHEFLPRSAGTPRAEPAIAATRHDPAFRPPREPAIRAIPAAADAPAPRPQPRAARRAAEEEPEDMLADAVQSAIRRLERGREADPSAGLLGLVEATAGVLEQQAAELRAVRAANARLATENERLRAMLKALLSAVDAGDRRLSDAVELAERRLRELNPRGAS
ncbi:hypothetical protein [Arenibaculum pallidiluteum]|uniref:hypothetical protein n=1 Tax=Arenibaculum pallidiluteum TaxID=2812559 RepID=UPI001A957516|nr:hypothetical protein [Arenibaculum pallidiluteum]